MISTLLLTRGQVAHIDTQDFPKVAFGKWSLSGNGKYAISSRQNKGVYLHRVLLEAQDGQLIDHRNGNGLDNRRENLRFCSPTQNNANRIAQAGRKIPFKGVTRAHDKKIKFVARINNGGKTHNLGTFITEEEAARAYDVAARRLHGDFAKVNFEETSGDMLWRTLHVLDDFKGSFTELCDTLNAMCKLHGGTTQTRIINSYGVVAIQVLVNA